MDVQLKEAFVEGKTMLPDCTIKGQMAGVYTDIEKMQLIMKQLEKKRICSPGYGRAV